MLLHRAFGDQLLRGETPWQGLIRRIGTGKQTDIWTSNWLPREGLMRPVCCIKDNPQKVSELIDPGRSWDRQLVGDFFIPMDADIIFSISLCTSEQEDFWAWQYEKSGIFFSQVCL